MKNARVKVKFAARHAAILLLAAGAIAYGALYVPPMVAAAFVLFVVIVAVDL